MLKQPSTNVKMTNVATIRYKINNKLFEIACYRNKALNWRNGVEQDVSEVLQTDEIFQNASHGIVAKKADLNKYFPNRSKREIIEIILQRGELQISDKERENQQSGVLADIIKIITQKCVHPKTKRRFNPEVIRQAIKDVHFPIKTDQTPKKQALQCIKLLMKYYRIERGEMRVRIIYQANIRQDLEKQLEKLSIFKYLQEDYKENNIIRVYDIEPSKYRQLNQLCKKIDRVTVEVLINVVVNNQQKNLQSEQFTMLEKKNAKNQEIIEKVQAIDLNIKEGIKEGIKEDKKEEKKLKCTTCGEIAVFFNNHELRVHFKSEWHVCNLKRKSKGLQTVTEQQFKIQNFNKQFV